MFTIKIQSVVFSIGASVCFSSAVALSFFDFGWFNRSIRPSSLRVSRYFGKLGLTIGTRRATHNSVGRAGFVLDFRTPERFSAEQVAHLVYCLDGNPRTFRVEVGNKGTRFKRFIARILRWLNIVAHAGYPLSILQIDTGANTMIKQDGSNTALVNRITAAFPRAQNI